MGRKIVVEEFNYTTLSIVFSAAVTGVGARIRFSYSWPGNSSCVWPRISRPPIKILRKNFHFETYYRVLRLTDFLVSCSSPFCR